MSVVLLVCMILALFAALLCGVPAMLAIGGVPLLFALAAIPFAMFDPALLHAFAGRVQGVMENAPLAAIPLFVLMGAILDRSGLSARMLAAIADLAGGSQQRLALAVLGVSALLAATTGVVGATIVMLATVALPGMLRAGVDGRHASGLVAASGTLGQLVPPSILLILLADQVSNAAAEAARRAGDFSAGPVAIGDLFAACVLPGLVLIGLYAAWIVFALPRRPAAAAPHFPRSGAGEILRAFAPPLLLILCVLGSILAGITTPTEAAGAGAAGALAMAALSAQRPRLARMLLDAGLDTVRLTGIVFSIVVAASMFALVFRGFGGDGLIDAALAGLPGEAGVALFAVMLAVFVLGFMLEFVEIVMIVVPVAGPALFAQGVDPLWFAVLLALNLQTSFLTPPFGLALFYFRAAAPAEISTGTLFRSVVPYVALQLLALALVWLAPELATWLPGKLR